MDNQEDDYLSVETVKFLCDIFPDKVYCRVVWRFKESGEVLKIVHIDQNDAFKDVEEENGNRELICIEFWRNGIMVGSIPPINKEEK